MAAKVAEPMIWLRDMAVAVERAADGRTARVRVRDNDALPSGERPALLGAEVIVEIHEPEASRARETVRGATGPGGVFGFPTPSEIASERITVSVRHRDFNPRRVRLDGKRLAVDLRAALPALVVHQRSGELSDQAARYVLDCSRGRQLALGLHDLHLLGILQRDRERGGDRLRVAVPAYLYVADERDRALTGDPDARVRGADAV